MVVKLNGMIGPVISYGGRLSDGKNCNRRVCGDALCLFKSATYSGPLQVQQFKDRCH